MIDRVKHGIFLVYKCASHIIYFFISNFTFLCANVKEIIC